jgi:hypothetical protein
MKHALVLVLSFALLACDASPAPEFFGAERSEHLRDGRKYVLYRKGTRFEVVRLGYARRGEHGAIRETMLALVPEVTGCRINAQSLRGDSGEMRGSLIC